MKEFKIKPKRGVLGEETIEEHDREEEEVEDSSSKISTEFYEEYFRLINSIKKEEELETSGTHLKGSSPTGSSHKKRKAKVKSLEGSLNRNQ